MGTREGILFNMGAEGIGRLTERERQCLRLVAQGYSTKEIARLISVSGTRASKIIDSANRKLGVSRRIEAARYLAEHEKRGVFVIPGTTPPLQQPNQLEASPTSTDEVGHRRLREERAPYGGRGLPGELGIPLRPRGGARNDLNTWQRWIWILALGALCLLGLGTLAEHLGSVSDRIVIVPQKER
jgi:DNA-binding CsgD family transcriptional regulator